MTQRQDSTSSRRDFIRSGTRGLVLGGLALLGGKLLAGRNFGGSCGIACNRASCSGSSPTQRGNRTRTS